ncbi:VOC family protein [Rhodovulum sp. DZ06]|uniref:VOC family protein n=1 Tax=Rhodovulum sp. DZ06 TaxID=3425126 RepID=UPI003D3372D3
MTAADTAAPLRAHITVSDAAAAIAFYRAAFGAEELFRLTDPGAGKIGHAELAIGASVLMLNDPFAEMGVVGPDALGGTPVALYLPAPDCDAALARAAEAGATVDRPAADQFFGERVAHLRDPFGHRWILAQQLEEVSPAEMQRRWSEMLGG